MKYLIILIMMSIGLMGCSSTPVRYKTPQESMQEVYDAMMREGLKMAEEQKAQEARNPPKKEVWIPPASVYIPPPVSSPPPPPKKILTDKMRKDLEAIRKSKEKS